METLTTILHYYKFDISKAADKTVYEALCRKLKDMGLKKLESFSTDHYSWYANKIRPIHDQPIILEVKTVYNDQWNTGPTSTDEEGLRVFDWAQAYYNKHWE